MAATKKLRYSLEEDQPTAHWEAGADVEYDEAPPAEYDLGADAEYDQGADPDYDEAGQADYDLGLADPDYDDVPMVAEVEAVVEPKRAAPLLAAADFAFELGWPVVPLTQEQPHLVVWRGVLKERHPTTGLVHRVPVYRLADAHWDCYREDELQAA